MVSFPLPDRCFTEFQHEIDLLESAIRTLSPTRDMNSRFYGHPATEFLAIVRDLRDEVEQRAFLAIVAAVEAILQVDFRARKRGPSNAPLRSVVRAMIKREDHGKRIDLDNILGCWSALPGIRRAAISEFRQLLEHRHWLAHGRHFANRSGVPGDPNFAIVRSRVPLAELERQDSMFPRNML